MKVRSIFLSDIHLGTRGCQAERLLEFLREHESQYLYLIGDIIDFWAMKRSIQWTPAQNTVVQKILRRARHGEHVMLIPGNHDEALREYDGVSFAKNRVKRAVSFIFDFDDSVIHAVRALGLDGVICGHIHCATITTRGALTYANCGDWVDSCTAIVEHFDGRLELIRAWQSVSLTVPVAAEMRPSRPVANPAKDMPLETPDRGAPHSRDARQSTPACSRRARSPGDRARARRVRDIARLGTNAPESRRCRRQDDPIRARASRARRRP